MSPPRIGVTLGDPSGIGPELILRALGADGGAGITVFGDPRVLAATAAALGLPPIEASGARLEAVTALGEVIPGRPDEPCGAAQIAYLEAAVSAAREHRLDGLCTAPIHKAAVKAAGFPFPGHTEFLAHRLGARGVAMMLAGPRLRVATVTTHVALADVPRTLTIERIARTCALTVEALHQDFGIAEPRIAVAALNPHAGEEGHFGREERLAIRPAIEAVAEGPLAERCRFQLTGPHVPDVVFRQAAAPPAGEGRFDAVVAMYHDQGLIPLKLLDFDEAVNVTLGLPLPRTSPDHGVAHDIAGRGLARDCSFRAALRLVRELARRRR